MFRDEYKKLVKAIAEQESDQEELQSRLDFLDARIRNMAKYVQAVCDHSLGTARASTMMRIGRMSVENYQNRVVTLDGIRRSAHDVAMASMDQINRFCDMYGVPHICTDKEDRVIRGNFCAAVTSELFMAGTGRATEEIRNGQALFYNESADMDSVVERVGNGEKIDTGREICRRS